MKSIIFGMLLSISGCLLIQNAKLNAEVRYLQKQASMTPAQKAKLKAQNGFSDYYQPTLVKPRPKTVAENKPYREGDCPAHLPYKSYWGCTVVPIAKK